MLIADSEASTKRCCGPEGCGSVNYPNIPGILDQRWCIGSKCMAWKRYDQIGIGPNGEKRERDMDGRTRWVDRGYCGLSGVEPAGFK